jgi:hypothetical protein
MLVGEGLYEGVSGVYTDYIEPRLGNLQAMGVNVRSDPFPLYGNRCLSPRSTSGPLLQSNGLI